VISTQFPDGLSESARQDVRAALQKHFKELKTLATAAEAEK